jgi:membrane-associated protein
MPEPLTRLVDFVLHVDVHLADVVARYGLWTYALLFLIVFCETGLVVTPFLPGDSLLFAAGALAATTAMEPGWLFLLLSAAAILGDSANYQIGRRLGARALRARWIKPEHVARTEAFFERYGGKTIVLARFVPIVRTYAPFVAGVARMRYSRFLFYNVLGGVLWVGLFVGSGYWFGNLPWVRRRFGVVVVAIVVLSLLPMVEEWARARRRRGRAGHAAPGALHQEVER